MIQHIVLLKLKAGTTEEQKQALLEGLVALQREHKIAGIESVSGGDNNSPEGKTHGFDWGFVMTFVDAAARDAYLPIPNTLHWVKRCCAPSPTTSSSWTTPSELGVGLITAHRML